MASLDTLVELLITPPDNLEQLNSTQIKLYLDRVRTVQTKLLVLTHKIKLVESKISEYYKNLLIVEHNQLDSEEKKQLAELKTQFDSTGDIELIRRVAETYPTKLNGKEFVVRNGLNFMEIKITHNHMKYIVFVDFLDGIVKRGKTVLGNVLVNTLREMLKNMSDRVKRNPILP